MQNNSQIQCNPYENPKASFAEIEKNILKFPWNLMGSLVAKTILKKNKRGLTFPEFKTYYKATVLKTMRYWHKNRNTDKWNRLENPGINPQHIWPNDF